MQVHATVIAYRGAGLMIVGDSGTGKSQLAADAIILGATLVADDQVLLTAEGGQLQAASLKGFERVLELRRLGLIRTADAHLSHGIGLIVELAHAAVPERLPEPATREYLGIAVPYFALPCHPTPHVASLLLYLDALHHGRVLPTDWCASSVV